jgi:hypothetical protein
MNPFELREKLEKMSRFPLPAVILMELGKFKFHCSIPVESNFNRRLEATTPNSSVCSS